MKRFFYLLLFGSPILLTIGCEGDGNSGEELPLTPPVVNHFECMTDGELMKSDSLHMYATYHEGTMQLVGWDNVSDGGKVVYLFFENPKIGQVYDLTDLPRNMASYIRSYDWDLYQDCHYEFENTLEGTLKVSKMDTIHQTISGTFEFSSYNPEGCSDNLSVTNGKFEMNYIDTRYD